MDVWSFEGLRRGMALHYAYVGPHLVCGSSLEDITAVIALHAGQGNKRMVASERYRKLELPEKPANLIAFVDMPALIRQIAAGEHERRQQWRNERCRNNMQSAERRAQQFRQRNNRHPANFAELRGVQDWCQTLGQETKLLLAPNTGKISCPVHGTAANFKVVALPAERRRVGEEEVILSAFGVWALRIYVDGDRIKADGRLIPAPQRGPKPRRPAQVRPDGPAEF